MPKSELEFIARAEPIGRPGLSALPLASHPTPHQMTRILKSSDPATVPVEGAICDIASAAGRIGIPSLHAEIQFRDPGKPGNVYSSEPCGYVGAKKGSDFVMFGQAFGVESRSIAESGNPITEIHPGATRARLVGVTGQCVTGREYTPQKGMQGQWIAGTSVIGGAGEANFKVRGGLKTDSLAMDNWLRIQRLTVLADQPQGTIEEFVSRVLSDEGFQSHGSEDTQETLGG